MSSSSKVVVWIIVILIILIGGFIYFTHMSDQGTYSANGAYSSSTDDGMNGVPPRNYDDSTVSATDTSNAALDSDMSNIDAQTNDLNNDSANADAGMSASSTQ